MPQATFTASDQETLLQVAHAAIRCGLNNDTPASISLPDFPNTLTREAASFVTLISAGSLRGCIGTLEAVRPLIEDVYINAFAAAFRDPRFPPLSGEEFNGVDISISVLSSPEAMSFHSEQDLLDQLCVGIDGLILEEGHYRGTFLPAVWESLPEPQSFFRQLKLKAGLRADHWSSTLRVYRYRTEVINHT